MTHHSAKVKMHLKLNGVIYPVAQMGPDFLILKQDLSVQVCAGEVIIEVDGSIQSFPVKFPNGVKTASKRIQMD